MAGAFCEGRRRTSRGSILVVDDEPSIVELICRQLRRAGYVVREFTDPQSVLRYCRREEPTLLISGVFMKGMTGLRLASEISFRFPRCQILLLPNGDELQTQGFRSKYAVLGRPFRCEELYTAVEKLLCNRRKDNGDVYD